MLQRRRFRINSNLVRLTYMLSELGRVNSSIQILEQGAHLTDQGPTGPQTKLGVSKATRKSQKAPMHLHVAKRPFKHLLHRDLGRRKRRECIVPRRHSLSFF